MMINARVTGSSQFLQLGLSQCSPPLISKCPGDLTLSMEIRLSTSSTSHHVLGDKPLNLRIPGEIQELKTTDRLKVST